MITRRWIGIAIVLAAMCVIAVPADAAKIRLGQVAPSGAFPGSCGGECDAFALDTAPASPSYVVPRGRWTVVSWRAQADPSVPGEARLRIYRPTQVDGRFRLFAQTRTRPFPAGTISVYRAHIRVRGGDLLGIGTLTTIPLVYQTPNAGDEIADPTCTPQVGDPVGAGTSCALTQTTGRRVNIAATLRRRHR
jgi:hypothetical protein